MLKRNIPLRCRVVERVLTIEIGIDTLKKAAETCEDFWQPHTDKYSLVVKDSELFAKDIKKALEHEDGEGSNRIHQLLDECILEAVENASKGLDFDAMEEIDDAEYRARCSGQGKTVKADK